MEPGEMRRTLNPRRSGGRGRRLAVLMALGGAAWMAPLPAAEPVARRCVPSAQYDCSLERCDRVTEGFQHAESFAYDPATGLLSACLWTVCYAGPAREFRAPASDETTLVGLLTAEHDGENHPPLTVSLTIDARRRFVAIWRYAGEGLTFDQGVCEAEPDRGIVGESGEDSV